MRIFFAIIFSSTIFIPALLVANRIAIIDAGSTGTRLFVYEQTTSQYVNTIYTMKNNEPLSNCIYDNKQAQCNTVNNLIQQANLNISNFKEIPLYIYATAGMRYLPPTQQFNLYNKIRKNIQQQGYNIHEIKTISGRDEALYDWIALNYLNHTLSPSRKTLGALDLGGSSTQIAFRVNGPTNATKEFYYNGFTYYIFAESLLGLGQKKIQESLSSTHVGRENCFPEYYWSAELTDNQSHSYNDYNCKYSILRYFSLENYDSKLTNVKTTYLGFSETNLFTAFSGFYYI